MTDLYQKYLRPQSIFTVLALIVITLNLSELIPDLTSIEQRKQYTPFYFQGLIFAGLDDVLHNSEVIGDYTDKDLSCNATLAQFAQAQYIVAPVMPDLNNLKHDLILFDCTSEEKAFEKIKDIGAMALRKNQFGIILARNPQ